MTYSVAIVGAGIGGLMAGAYLAKAGYPVTLMEKASTPGGSAGWYNRKNRMFPTGATLAFGLEHEGVLAKLLHELDIHLQAAPLDYPMKVLLSDREISIYRDRQLWEAELCRGFPERASDVLSFWRELTEVARTVLDVTDTRAALPIRRLYDLGTLPSLLLRKPWDLLGLVRRSLWTVEDLLRKHRLADYTPLRQFLNVQLVDAAQTDVRHAALLPSSVALDIYRRGSFAMEGGLGSLARRLAEKLEQAGGALLYSTSVHRVEFDPNRSKWIVESKKQQSAYDILINNTGLTLMSLDPAGQHHGPQEGWGAFRLDALLRAEALSALAPALSADRLPFAYQLVPDPAHSNLIGDEHGPVYVTFHRALDRHGLPIEGEVLMTASVHTVAGAWLHASAEDYMGRKAAVQTAVLAEIRKVLPELETYLLFAEAGTPRTYMRYIGKGEVGGIPLTVDNAIRNPRSIRGAMPGLYHAGENVFPGPGTLSAALSGYFAARAIMKEYRLFK